MPVMSLAGPGRGIERNRGRYSTNVKELNNAIIFAAGRRTKELPLSARAPEMQRFSEEREEIGRKKDNIMFDYT